MVRDQFFEHVCRDEAAARDFLLAIHDIAHVWDDLIDKDKQLSDDQINDAFFKALVVIPNNPFYRQHFGALQPLVVTAILNWLTANKLEDAGSEDDKRIAFVTRSAYTDLITYVAMLVGGPGWAVQQGPEIRRFVHAEGYEAYLDSLAYEKAAQQGE